MTLWKGRRDCVFALIPCFLSKLLILNFITHMDFPLGRDYAGTVRLLHCGLINYHFRVRRKFGQQEDEERVHLWAQRDGATKAESQAVS